MAVENHIESPSDIILHLYQLERTDLPNHCCPTSEPIAQIEYIFLPKFEDDIVELYPPGYIHLKALGERLTS